MSEARIQLDAQVQVRRDIEANWAAVDPVLRDGEIAYSKDLNRIKVGDGARKWSELEYVAGSSASLSLDTEMSDTSENPVQNKVIKAYVDGKAAEAQAAAEQYIQDEVLTYYATTKYVEEREGYIVGYAEGLVSDLEKEIDGRGYLTSAALGSYATKDEIKNFVTKGSTLEHYGITDAVKSGSNFIPTAIPNIIGYSGIGEGWPAGGPAMVWGVQGYYARLQVEMATDDNPTVFISKVVNNKECGWAKLLTDQNFSTFGIANMSNNATGSANDILTSSVYGIVDSLTDIPIYYGNLLTFAARNAYYQSQLIINYKSEMAIRGRSGSWSDWARVVTDKNFATYGIKAGVLKTTGSANDLTVPSIAGDVESLQDVPFHYCNILTITTTPHYYVGQIAIDYNGRMATRGQDGSTWSAWRTVLDTTNIANYAISSNGGTINAGKYLKFGTNASLVYAEAFDGYEKLIISGLTEIGNIHVRERVWLEDGCTLGFRNWRFNTSESISSFSDLKTLLNLMAAEATIADGGDFNDLTTPGAYTFMSEAISNSPTGFGNLLTIRGKSDYYISQLAIKHDGEMYLRTKTDKQGADGDYWTEWRTIVDSASALTMLMGMGQGAVNNGNLNDITRPGAYTVVGQSLSNYKYQYGTMLAISGTDDYFVSQLAMNASGEVSTRVREGGTWKNWRTLLDESNCGSYCLKAVSSDYYTFLLTSKTTDGVTRFVIQDANQSLLFGAAFWGGNTATIRNYVASRELRISDTLTFGDSTVGFYELMTAKGGAFSGNITCNGGITLGGETINSWADVRSSWAGSAQTVNSGVTTIEVVSRVKKSILTTLTNSHRLTFTLNNQNSSVPEWIIRFKTGSSVPSVGISLSNGQTLSWQNGQNILNNLQTNTEYRIYIDGTLAMYDTFK